MKTFKLEFVKTYSYQLEIDALDRNEAEELAEEEFDRIKNPLEEAQQGYWEIVECEEVIV